MFWNVFYKLCEENNTKPNTVAKTIGVSSAICTKWKNGTIPNGDTLLKLADCFDVSVDYLLGRTDKPTSNTNITGNTQNNINGSNNIGTAPASADGISEKFMQIFNNLPFEQQLEIMSLALEKSKKI